MSPHFREFEIFTLIEDKIDHLQRDQNTEQKTSVFFVKKKLSSFYNKCLVVQKLITGP